MEQHTRTGDPAKIRPTQQVPQRVPGYDLSAVGFGHCNGHRYRHEPVRRCGYERLRDHRQRDRQATRHQSATAHLYRAVPTGNPSANNRLDGPPLRYSSPSIKTARRKSVGFGRPGGRIYPPRSLTESCRLPRKQKAIDILTYHKIDISILWYVLNYVFGFGRLCSVKRQKLPIDRFKQGFYIK